MRTRLPFSGVLLALTPVVSVAGAFRMAAQPPRSTAAPVSAAAPRVATRAATGISTRLHTAAARQDTAGRYTAEQAGTGAVVFTRVCIECHETKDMSSADFRAKWSGRPAFDLFELIRSTMPDGNPGSLSRQEYAASVAYIMKLNGLVPGVTSLPSDSVALAAITLLLPSTPRSSEKF